MATARKYRRLKKLPGELKEPRNAYGESFNSIFRTTCLNRWTFESVIEARAVIDQWREEYNTTRPHGSLSGRPPVQFIEDWANGRLEYQLSRKWEMPNFERGPKILGWTAGSYT